MNGGPSHVDTFDPKPMLVASQWQAGADQPADRAQDRRGHGLAVPLPASTARAESRSASLFAHTAEMIDDICVIRSMHADVPNHEPSLMLMNCGEARQARPCVGSWVLYGLGTENQNLPGFIVMCPGGFPIAESQNWQSAFLPGIYQGTYIDSRHTDIEKLIAHIRNRVGRPASPARAARPAGRAQSPAPRSPSRRGRARGAHPVVRAGVPHAVRSGRRVRHHPGARVDPRDVWPGRARPPAPGDPAAARARRPLRSALARRRPALGPSRRPGDRPPRAGQPVRPADRARSSRT